MTLRRYAPLAPSKGTVIPRIEAEPHIRFWRRVDQSSGDSGCWLWLAGLTTKGYGSFGVSSARTVLAHRFAYEESCGPVPEGYELDHLCRNRQCVNPAHLEVVTHAENVRRGRSGEYLRTRTHCKNGHPFAGDNLRLRPDGTGRVCRICKRESVRKARRRQRSLVTPELRIAVIHRDGGCIAPRFQADLCAGRLTLDHVQEGYGRMGLRAPSDERHLVTLCWHHHMDGWATSHKPDLRAYLARLDSPHSFHVDPVPGCEPCYRAIARANDRAHSGSGARGGPS